MLFFTGVILSYELKVLKSALISEILGPWELSETKKTLMEIQRYDIPRVNKQQAAEPMFDRETDP